MRKKSITILIFLFFLITCKKQEKVFEANLGLNLIKVIKKDAEKKPLVLDVEVTYPDCPGHQIEILRGNRDFANCILENYKVGDTVTGSIRWKWDTLGFYRWQIERIGKCERWVDPQDEFSYEMVEECEDYIVYGSKVGFVCKRIPTANLIAKCPWFRRE